MSKTDQSALVKETKTLISEVEAGQTDHAAWVAIQDRVRQLYEGRTQREVGELLGKSEDWAARVLRWKADRGTGPFADPKDPRKGGGTTAVKKALRDPEQRKQVIEALSPAERAAIVKEVSSASVDDADDRDDGIDLGREMEEAVAEDLSAQVAKLIAGASRIDLLLAERGAEFKRINSEDAARLDADLERVVKTIRDVRAELLKHREIGVAA